MAKSVRECALALAIELNPSIGTTRHIVDICESLVRQARAYDRLQCETCNGPRGVEYMNSAQIEAWQTGLEKREERCEKRIRKIVDQFPTIDGKAIEPIFSGDPRGCVVKLKMPDGRFNDWGREGICVEI
jgi:hypothetical protein